MNKDPLAVLELPSDADEAAIRRRYLELVRQFPPDRAPERFAEVRAAYDELRHPSRRLERQLSSLATDDTLEALSAEVRKRLFDARLPASVLLSLAESP